MVQKAAISGKWSSSYQAKPPIGTKSRPFTLHPPPHRLRPPCDTNKQCPKFFLNRHPPLHHNSPLIAIVGLSLLPYTAAVFVKSMCCVCYSFIRFIIHFISSLFLSSSCMSTGSFAAATALPDHTAIDIRLLKGKATACAALPFEMRTDWKSVEA